MITILTAILGLYIAICLLMYLFQERLIFLPQKLSADYNFVFHNTFEEVIVRTSDNQKLHGLLFKANNPKGLIFYLHGNAGSVAGWGDVAEVYTPLGYDVFLLDYRGYGKSEGNITSEQQIHEDVQRAYDAMLERYSENMIIVLGYSIGTGPATKLAATNDPGMLILQAPFYSLPDVARKLFPFVPGFLVKYKFDNASNLKACKMQVIILHGDADEVIDSKSSEKLKPFLKQGDRRIVLPGVGHNGMTFNEQYVREITSILNRHGDHR